MYYCVKIIFYVSIIISEFVEYLIQNKIEVSAKLEDVFKYINIFLVIIFVLFTFLPPILDLFKDKINNKFGI